jgi:hypothetical protein
MPQLKKELDELKEIAVSLFKQEQDSAGCSILYTTKRQIFR